MRDLHELWFNIVLALIVLHVAAILFYRLRGRHLTKPMITGKAVLDPEPQPMKPGKWWVALICLAVAIGDRPLDHRRRAAFRSLIETRGRPTSRPC